MDIFIEKIVARKKDAKDLAITAGTVLGSILVFLISLNIPVVNQLGLIVFAGLVYLCYRVIISRNIEFEYIVTNGDLDIDRIVAKRKRKRIFSASCKEFDIIAKMSNTEEFRKAAHSAKVRIDASSSAISPNAYFVTASYKGEKTLVVFEPDERMLGNFKIFIPKKMLFN